MEENKVYYKELACYEKELKKQIKIKCQDGYFDLMELPTNIMREEMRSYIFERGKTVSYSTICHDKTYYKQVCSFLCRKTYKM